MSGAVRLGIEYLLADGPAGRHRLGLLSNQAAILPDGVAVWRALLRAGFPLARLFAPEHGFAGRAQDAVEVSDERLGDLEVVSLYGKRNRPEPHHLTDLDAVVIDIQDVGCRYYTYLYSAAAVIEECLRHGVEPIVCDRPNPIGAVKVEGGGLAPEAESEVGGYGLAQRHGLTIGEFARYLQHHYLVTEEVAGSNGADRAERASGGVGYDSGVTIHWMGGYRREMLYGDTRLPWKQPSPNLPHPETALVYPGTCLFEGTNISEGRGTTRPFETIGAPWIDGERLREELSHRGLPGVVFSSVEFTPTFSAFANRPCGGVQLHVTDPESFLPLYTGVVLLDAVRRQDPERFDWRPLWEDETRSFVDLLAGGSEFRGRVDAGADTEELYDVISRDGNLFLRRREAALQYGRTTEVTPRSSENGGR